MKIAPILIIFLFAASALGILIVSQVTPLDPLAQFRTADGRISVPGGQMTPDIQRLLFPAPAPKTYTDWAPVRSAYPTLAILGTVRDLPTAGRSPTTLAHSQSLLPNVDLLGALRSFMGFFISDASAADRYLVGAAAGCVPSGASSNVATSTNCWSTSNGGANGASVPGVSDNIILGSSAGTSLTEMNAAMSVVNFTQTQAGSGVRWTTGSATLGWKNFTVSGNVTISHGALITGNSTIVISGNVVVNADGANSSYLKSDAGGSWTVSGAWTNNSVANTWNLSAPLTFNATSAKSMNFGNAVNFNSGGTGAEFLGPLTFDPNASVTSFSYTMPGCCMLTYASTLTIRNSGASGTVTLNLGSQGISQVDASSDGTSTIGARGALIANDSSMSIRGNWDSSAGTFTAGTSFFSLDGRSGTETVNTANPFYNLAIFRGPVTALSNLTASQALAVETGGTLDAGAFSLSFNSLTIQTNTSTLKMNGITITNSDPNNDITMTTTSGTIELTAWTTYSASDIRWTFNPSSSGATVTTVFTGRSGFVPYDLKRDGITIDTEIAGASGLLTLSATGGWSSHAMEIVQGSSTPPAASDQTMYACSNGGAYTEDSHLYKVSQTTGVATLVGTMQDSNGLPVFRCSSLVFGLDHSMYTFASDDEFNANTYAFYSVNPNTGIITKIHEYGMFMSVTDMDFGPNGVLYVVVQNGDGTSCGSGSTALCTVDLTTGAMTLVGTMSGGRGQGLAFGPNGTLYFTKGASLYTLSTTDASATLIGSMGLSLCSADQHKAITAMKFDSRGTLYGLACNFPDETGLVTINPSTATATFFAGVTNVSSYPIDGMAFAPLPGVGTLPPPPPPTAYVPPTAADIVAGVELALAAIIVIGLAGIFVFRPQGRVRKWAWIIVGLAALALVLIYFAPAFFNF